MPVASRKPPDAAMPALPFTTPPALIAVRMPPAIQGQRPRTPRPAPLTALRWRGSSGTGKGTFRDKENAWSSCPSNGRS